MVVVQKIIIVACLFSSVACKNVSSNTGPKVHEVRIGLIKFSLDTGYRIVNGGGVESKVMFMINDQNDTLQLEYGDTNVVFDLFDAPPQIMPIANKESFSVDYPQEISSGEIVFSNSPEQDRTQNIFQENYYMYDTIHTIIAKIVQPKKIGRGMTGLYVPVLKNGMSLSVFGRNLDSASHKIAMRVFQSITY